jgi:hypothetical protein
MAMKPSSRPRPGRSRPTQSRSAGSRRLSLSTSPIRLLAEDAVGYRPDDDVAGWLRTVLIAVVAVGAMFAGALTIWTLNQGELPRIRQNTSSLIRLDDFTRHANRTARNTMPAFLALPGDLGQLSADGSTINEIDVNPLRDVVCTPSLALLVRQEWPGYYDRIPNDQLERAVLKKRPEYRDRLCTLPAWIDATPHDIVKYELKPLPPFRSSVLVWSILAIVAYVIVVLNMYYRVLVRLASDGHAHAHA